MEEQKDLGSYSEDGTAGAVSVPSTGSHTPGPWFAGGAVVWVDSRYQACCGRGSVNGCCGEPDIAGDYHEIANTSPNNARLIASAPELLEALKWAMAEVRGQTKYDNRQQKMNCFTKADAAIAKALGQ